MGRPDGAIGNSHSSLMGILAHNCLTTLDLVSFPRHCSVVQSMMFGPILEGPNISLPSFASLFPPQQPAAAPASAQNNAGQNTLGLQLDGRYVKR